MKPAKKQGRISSTAIITILSRFACRTSVAISAFLQFPAFLFSCTQVHNTENTVHLTTTKAAAPALLDLFFFEADEPFLLDSYQQIPSGESRIYGLSAPGDKRVVALSALSHDIYARSYIRVLGDLSAEVLSIEADNPVSPFLHGTAFLPDGLSRTLSLDAAPLLCRIHLRSLCCNFRERPYSEEPFKNTQLYLMNAVTGYAPAGVAGGRPVSWENIGVPSSESPLLRAPGIGVVGAGRVFPDVSLYCYPNPTEEESPGTPFTRFVLEGDVGNVHCYYPINLPAMLPGANYELDVTLMRIGTSDPDTAASPEDVTYVNSILPWHEKPPHTEIY